MKKLDDEYYLQPPIDQYFYRFIANMMSIYSVGDRQLWGYPRKTLLYEINNVIMSIFAPVCGLSQLTFVYDNFSELSFDTLGIIFSLLPVTGLTIKVITLEKVTRWTTAYLVFFFTLSGIGWITIPLINNYKNEELVLNHTRRLQTSVYLWMPFDYGYNYNNWLIIHTINCYVVVCGVCCTMIFQCQNYIYVYNVIWHLHVLKNSLRTDFTAELRDEEVLRKLGKILQHHTFIIKVFKEVQNAFGFNVAATYMQNFFGNSVVMYQIMYGGKENMMLYVLIVFAYTGVPILMSFVLEEIQRESDDLPNVVYGIPWENMSISNQKIVMLILQRSQELMVFKAFAGMKAGVGPMVSILKTTFSYYVMLESSIEK